MSSIKHVSIEHVWCYNTPLPLDQLVKQPANEQTWLNITQILKILQTSATQYHSLLVLFERWGFIFQKRSIANTNGRTLEAIRKKKLKKTGLLLYFLAIKDF